jgi:protein-L-isoaspartate(D-aspartate) O-methyltransferase
MTSDAHIRYAEEILALSGTESPALLRALSVVRREDFLPPGPWMIEALSGLYYLSADADPRHVLHGVGVALDPARALNNANPVRFAETMKAVNPQPGETVFHVGAGVGYFSAVLAEMVGPTGRVLAAEIDEDLRERARGNLAGWPRVELIGDALSTALPPIDILYSSAGLGTLPPAWLAALRPGGRMIMPMTDANDYGLLFLFHKIGEGRPWAARMLSFTRHYPCQGTRETGDLTALTTALITPPTKVASLRLDRHDKEASCWLHNQGWCLSTRAPA